MASHHKAAFKVLRYLKGYPSNGLFFLADSSLQLKAFNDNDWARCPNIKRSVTGFCIYLGNSLISWKSIKQHTVSHSSTEAEYKELIVAMCEIQWLTFLLQDLHVPFTKPALLYCHNRFARQLAPNLVFHICSKHIQLDYHVVHEKGVRKAHPSPSNSVSILYCRPPH